MPRIEELDPESQEFIRNYKCRVNDTVPWTVVDKPLHRSRIALVTSAGLHRRDDRPFNLLDPGGDPSFRVIPRDSTAADLTVSIISANWDRSGLAADLNVVFPLDRLIELAERGIIGEVAEEHYAFMGSIFAIEPVIAGAAPEVGRRLRAAAVDAALLVPV